MSDGGRAAEIRAWLDAVEAKPPPTPVPPSSAFIVAAGKPITQLERLRQRLEQVQTGKGPSDVPVLSDAALAGDMGPAILERSAKLKALRAAGDLDAGLAYFRDSPADGCTSIVDLARISTGYNPSSPNAADNLRRFQAFASKIVESPVFDRELLDQKPLSWKPSSWSRSVTQVVREFPHISEADAAKIRKSVQRLTRAAASNPGRRQSGSLFVQNLLLAEGQDFQLFLYYASASFKEIHEKKKDPVYRASMTLARARLRFLATAWPDFAEAVWNKHVCAVEDWLDRNTTPARKSPVTFCFD